MKNQEKAIRVFRPASGQTVMFCEMEFQPEPLTFLEKVFCARKALEMIFGKKTGLK